MVAELAKELGKKVLVRDGTVKYEATIIDVKVVYGEPLFCVVPVCGSGSKWIKNYCVKLYQ